MSEHPREQEQEQDKPQAAVALKYDPAREGAPRVTAKGKGLIASRFWPWPGSTRCISTKARSCWRC